jgi:hypothetical protein
MEIALLGLFFCHFLCDFTPLLNNWMLNAKRLGTPLFPIAVHACIHSTLMYGFLLTISPNSIWLALFQFSTHFLIDVWKGKMSVWFATLQNPLNKMFWVIFGFDQFLHAVVIILMLRWI